MHTILKTNAASVPSQLGGGQHDLFDLVLNDALYLNLTGTDFIKLPNPGTVATISTNSIGPQIDERVLYENYGVITVVDIEDNDTRMRKPYTPTFSIEALLHQIEIAVEYAAAVQVVSRAYLLVLQTGVYPEACRDWDKKQLILKTWPLFKTFFAAVHRDLRLIQTAPNQAVFGTEKSIEI